LFRFIVMYRDMWMLLVCAKYIHTYIHTYRQTDYQAGRQAGRLASRQTDKYTCRHTGRHRQTDRQTDRQAGRKEGSHACVRIVMHVLVVRVRVCVKDSRSYIDVIRNAKFQEKQQIGSCSPHSHCMNCNCSPSEIVVIIIVVPSVLPVVGHSAHSFDATIEKKKKYVHA